MKSMTDIVKAVHQLITGQAALEARVASAERRQGRLERDMKRMARVHPEGEPWELGSKLEVPHRPRGLPRNRPVNREVS